MEKWERYYPNLFTMAFVIAVIAINPNLCILDDVDSILGATISFASIIIGFLGALVALIFSTENRVMNIVIEDEYYSNRMRKFFLRPIQSGFVLVFLSILFSFRVTLHNMCLANKVNVDKMMFGLKLIWLYLFVYFLVSSYRAISIILKIVFINQKEDNANTHEKEDEIIPDEEYEKIKDENSI